MCPAARDYGCWQAFFSRESGRISRKNCAVQRSKGPPIGLVDMFQTSPKAPVCRDRRPRAASLAPSCQFPFCPHRPAGPMALTVYRSRGRVWAPAPTTLRVAQHPRLQVGAALVAARGRTQCASTAAPQASVPSASPPNRRCRSPGVRRAKHRPRPAWRRRPRRRGWRSPPRTGPSPRRTGR